MSREDDVELIRVDGPATYEHDADGPVNGFRIADGQGDLGVLWYAQDPAQDAAGIAYLQHSERAANAAVHWFRLLREAKARRLPAQQAAIELAASHADPAPWGAAGQLERWASLRDLQAEVRLNEA